MRRWARFVTTAAICLVGPCLGGAGCSDSSDSAPQPTTTSPWIPAPQDRSLDALEYVRRGFPAYDRVWSGQDFNTAITVLSGIVQDDPGLLPRYQSPRSGEVFAALVSPVHLELCSKPSLPLDVRAPNVMSLLQVYNSALTVYARAVMAKAASGSEMIEIMGAMLRTTALVPGLIDEVLPTLSPEDPTYRTRMDGLATMKRGMGEIVTGAIMSLSDRQTCTVADLRRLVGYMRGTLPTIVPHLTPAARTETVQLLSKAAADPAAGDLQPALGQLLAEVRAAASQAQSN